MATVTPTTSTTRTPTVSSPFGELFRQRPGARTALVRGRPYLV
jgi:hypothetical protein